jgi:hypothetical protein
LVAPNLENAPWRLARSQSAHPAALAVLFGVQNWL